MFDIGWQELFIVAVLGIIIIGPKDLPRAIRAVSGLVRKARNMARDFQDGVDDVIREAELDDVKEQVEKVSRFDAAREIKNAIDPTGDLAGDFGIGDAGRDSAAAGDRGDAAKPPAKAAGGETDTAPPAAKASG
ncbi:MAG: twin-arginine translocase subunit TatB [Magnetovibrio sp.]|nr:twin-arginine translocase subunit TatB [Magnetovibrio sp.]